MPCRGAVAVSGGASPVADGSYSSAASPNLAARISTDSMVDILIAYAVSTGMLTAYDG